MSAEERNLLEMVQLAVIAADDGDTPDGMRARTPRNCPGSTPSASSWDNIPKANNGG